MKPKLLTCVIVLGLSASSVSAGEMDTPHRFRSGTPAFASEVNENFQAAETAINDNDARIANIEAEVVASKYVVLQNGLAGYSGTIDTTLTKTETDWTNLGIGGDQPAAERFAAAYDPAQATDVAVGLLRFDLTGQVEDMLRGGETCASNIVVMDAILELRGNIPDGRFASVTMVDPSGPLWIEADATWDQSDAGSNWPAGTFTETPVFNSVLRDISDKQPGLGVDHSIRFSIDTEYVQQWVCDDSLNKGLMIGQSEDASTFISSEHSRVPLRPKLKLLLRRN